MGCGSAPLQNFHLGASQEWFLRSSNMEIFERSRMVYWECDRREVRSKKLEVRSKKIRDTKGKAMSWFKRKKRTSGNQEIPASPAGGRDWEIRKSGDQGTDRISGYPDNRIPGTGRIPESPGIRNPSSRRSTRNRAQALMFSWCGNGFALLAICRIH